MATLDVTAQIRLNASGNGTASIGPIGMRETWNPATAHVRVSSAVNEAVCAIYVGDRPEGPNYRETTFTGSTGDATSRVEGKLRVPEKVWAVWTGGDPGALAVLNVNGSKTV